MEINISVSNCGKKHKANSKGIEFQPKKGDSVEFMTDRLTDKGPCTTKISHVDKKKFVTYFDDDDSSVLVDLEEEADNITKGKSEGYWIVN